MMIYLRNKVLSTFFLLFQREMTYENKKTMNEKNMQ